MRSRATTVGAVPTGAKKSTEIAAHREYSLLALIDLSQALTLLPLDPYRIADTLLLNLRGHFQLSRACLWLLPEGGAPTPVLVRSQGMSSQDAWSILASTAGRLLPRLQAKPEPLRVTELDSGEGETIASRAGLALFAPLCSGSEVIGIVGLGPRGDEVAYSDLDVQALRASLAIAGVALQNARFQSRLLERTRELRKISERLRDADRLKSEFLANVNHELRTPLSVIIASLECLTRLEESAAPGHEFVEFASRQSKKLQQMIEGVLTFSAASEGSLPPDLTVGDVGAFVDSYYRERLPGIGAGLREFVCAVAGDPLDCRFDPEHLRHILDAVIDNAVKFTSPGSRITLRVHATTEEGDPFVRIDVSDRGPGIPLEHLAHIFEPFRQGDGSSTRAVGGIGIGLALAQRLATGLGGRLLAESNPEGGSTFSLLLPSALQNGSEAADTSVRGRSTMPNELEIEPVVVRGRAAVVRIKGSLDVKSAPQLIQRATEVQANGQDMVLNLSEVSFIGSSGIGALLVIAEQFHDQAGRVRFASPSAPVAAVLKVLNLHRFLTVDETEEDALAALSR